MKHGSLFSGIGGFDLAAEWMGWENVFHCEWNEFGQKVLKHYWPKAISYEDITKTDFTIHRGNIDILTGGFPCQPYSSAGKRLGKEDERHLWPQMLRAIREIKPRWVVGENVYGLVNWSGGLVFHEVQADLEAQGYEVQPYLLPAVSVNAPHRRDRIWFVAHAKNDGYGRGNKFGENIGIQERSIHKCEGQGWDEIRAKSERLNEEWSSSNPNNSRTNIGMPSEREWQESNGIGGLAQPELGQTGRDGDAADTECSGLEYWDKTRNILREEGKARTERGQSANEFEANGNGKCHAANTNGIGLRRQGDWIGESRFIRNNSKRSNWSNFPSVSPVCVRDDGFSDRLDGITFPKWRNESIKAGGNAVVPQVVYQIFKTIEQYEILNNVHNPTH